MPKRYFNWKLATVLVIGLIVLGVTAFSLRKWQRNRMAYGALEKGNEAYEKCLWQEAATQLGTYIAVVQDDVPVLLKYADAQLNIRPLKRSNLSQSINAYRAVLRLDKSNSEAFLKLVGVYLQVRMYGEAELIARRAIKENPSLELRRMLAIALANQRKFSEAAEELQSIIEKNPEQVAAYDILGKLTEYRPEDFPQSSQIWYDEAVKNNPSSPEAYIIRGAYYLRHGDTVKALVDFELAEQKDLSNIDVRLRLAEQFISANILDKAQKHLEVVQASEPDNQKLWAVWVNLALKSNEKSIMFQVAESGLKELSSQPWDFMGSAAELYIRCGELTKAGECVDKLSQNDIAPATTAFLEGMLAERKGRRYEAVKCWNRAIQLGAEFPRIKIALAITLSQLGDKQSAIRQLRTLVSERPNLFGGRLALARLLTQTGNWDEAVEHAYKAMQLSPQNFEAALLHSQALMQLLVLQSAPDNAHVWQNMDEQLTRLEAIADDSDEDAFKVKFLRFRIAVHRGNFTEAQILLDELKDKYKMTNPDKRNTQMKIAMAEVELLVVQKKEEKAILILNNIIKDFPGAVEPVRYFAILLARQDKKEQCEAVVKDALSNSQEIIIQRNLCFLLADLYKQWGEKEKIYNLLTSFVQKLPDDIPLKRRLLNCSQIVKKPEKAQQLIDDIKLLEGEDGWQWRCEQAKIWLLQNNFKDMHPKIISILKENLFTNPNDQTSRMLLGVTYERAGQLQLAVSTYREALSRSPKDISIIVPMVAALYKINEYEQADEILRKATEEKLFHPKLKQLELQSYLERGELESADDIMGDLLASDPNNQSINLALALLKIRQGKFTEAEYLLNKLKDVESDMLPVKITQIELNIRQNKFKEALQLCDELISDSNDAFGLLLRAKTYAMVGQNNKAEKDFEQAIIIEPSNAKSWTARSDFYRSIGKIGKAVSDIKKAMSLTPDDIVVQKRAISLFMAYNDHDIRAYGKTILDKALMANPDDADLDLYKARFLLSEKVERTATNIDHASRILQKITENQPMRNEAWQLLAELAVEQGQPNKAMDITFRGLVYQPDNKSLLLLKARLEAARSPSLAVPTLESLHQLYPDDLDVAIQLAKIYQDVGQSQKSIDFLEKQLASHSKVVEKRKIEMVLAEALYVNGRKSEALEKLDSLLLSAPDDPGPLLVKTLLLKVDKLWDQISQKVTKWCKSHPDDTYVLITVAGDLAETEDSQAKTTAENLLRESLDRNPDSPTVAYLLALLLQKTHREAESVTFYQQVLASQPDNVIAINNLAWILCEVQGKYEQALELVQKGLKITPDYVDLIDTRGVIYHKLGQYDKAIQDFTKCLELYPDGMPSAVFSYVHLGKAQMDIGEKNNAVESFKKALELNNKIECLSAIEVADMQRMVQELSQGA